MSAPYGGFGVPLKSGKTLATSARSAVQLYDEYAARGTYHRAASPDWSYFPIYRRKLQLVRRLFDAIPKGARVLDAGCGEGVLVEELHAKGYEAIGVDRHCATAHVLRSDILALPFAAQSFDVVLFLDVIEHLPFSDQARALAEIHRVLRSSGKLIISIPNLAHLYSRIRFLTRGKLKRTASIEKHPGDRPIAEFLGLLKAGGFRIERRYGIFPTLPFFYRWMQRRPRQTLWLHSLLNAGLAFPNICFLNLLVCEPGKDSCLRPAPYEFGDSPGQ